MLGRSLDAASEPGTFIEVPSPIDPEAVVLAFGAESDDVDLPSFSVRVLGYNAE